MVKFDEQVLGLKGEVSVLRPVPLWQEKRGVRVSHSFFCTAATPTYLYALLQAGDE